MTVVAFASSRLSTFKDLIYRAGTAPVEAIEVVHLIAIDNQTGDVWAETHSGDQEFSASRLVERGVEADALDPACCSLPITLTQNVSDTYWHLATVESGQTIELDHQALQLAARYDSTTAMLIDYVQSKQVYHPTLEHLGELLDNRFLEHFSAHVKEQLFMHPQRPSTSFTASTQYIQ